MTDSILSLTSAMLEQADRSYLLAGPFMMGPDAAMAGAALADMARRWANSQSGFGGGGQNMENAPQLPLLIDLIENENQYLLTADVPGLQKSDLKVRHFGVYSEPLSTFLPFSLHL